MWQQMTVELAAKRRGFHLITSDIERAMTQLKPIEVGLAHCFIQHTSASLSINENADPTVRADMEAYFHRLVPENTPYFQHTYEGPDDMPAHIKAAMIGNSVTIPVQNGRLLLGTWQGIYLGEHRNHGGSRRVILTLQGQ